MAVVSRKVLLARLSKVTERLSTVEGERDRAVAAAMAGGCSWAEIGTGLGVSAQGAHRRFRDVRVDEDGFMWREPRLPL
jgi:ECF sigma factor